MKVNIVMDNPNNWYYSRVVALRGTIRQLGHACMVCRSQADVPAGSDVTFYLGCEDYITKKSRAQSRYSIVVHASDLPKGKGMSPTTWQILEGKKEIPVTLFEVADGFDAGDYYLKDSFKLDGTELIDEWQEKLGACIDGMVLKFLKQIKKLKPIPQKGRSTVYKRRGPADSELDINKPIRSQFNLLRVVDNERYPAFFCHKNCKYVVKIYKA